MVNIAIKFRDFNLLAYMATFWPFACNGYWYFWKRYWQMRDINMLKIIVWLAHQHDNLNVDEDEKEVNLLSLALKMDCSVHEVEGQDLHQLYLTRGRVLVHFRLKHVVKSWSLPPETRGQKLVTSAWNTRSKIGHFRPKHVVKDGSLSPETSCRRLITAAWETWKTSFTSAWNTCERLVTFAWNKWSKIGNFCLKQVVKDWLLPTETHSWWLITFTWNTLL